MDVTLNRIIEELKSQNKRQSDLTDYLEITDSSFGNWKKGLNKSYLKYLHGIADFLGVSVEYLRGETDQKKKTLVNADEELTEYLEELKNRNEMRMLFSVTKYCTKEEVEQAVRIIEALRKKDD